VTLSNACSDVVVQRSFSNKPRATGKFSDFFEKIESYVGIISGPAIERHNVHPYTFRVVEPETTPSVFRFRDTLSSLAEITDLSAKLTDDVIAIIGLGGTGAFVLDFLVRTPVREIRGFDGDAFHVHNAFRSPGAVNDQEFGEKKAVVYKARYDNFRNGISTRPTVIDASSEGDLAGVTFVFVCVDKGPARAAIFDVLLAQGLPFIDVGMGLNRTRGAIGGMLRVTCHQPSVTSDVRKRAPLTDAPDDIYRNNIQISELNALNACLAVIRYKQLRGFYEDEVATSDILFGISDLGIAKA
jgi:molybdopterin/thiamine biosynthesis adenylyltransferase